jgi:hypothetical protein
MPVRCLKFIRRPNLLIEDAAHCFVDRSNPKGTGSFQGVLVLELKRRTADCSWLKSVVHAVSF